IFVLKVRSTFQVYWENVSWECFDVSLISVKTHGVACKYLCQPFVDVTVGQLLFFAGVNGGSTMSKQETNKRSTHQGAGTSTDKQLRELDAELSRREETVCCRSRTPRARYRPCRRSQE